MLINTNLMIPGHRQFSIRMNISDRAYIFTCITNSRFIQIKFIFFIINTRHIPQGACEKLWQYSTLYEDREQWINKETLGVIISTENSRYIVIVTSPHINNLSTEGKSQILPPVECNIYKYFYVWQHAIKQEVSKSGQVLRRVLFNL